MIRFTYEGSWLYLSTFGRTVNGSKGPLAEMCTFVTLRGSEKEAHRRLLINRERIHQG